MMLRDRGLTALSRQLGRPSGPVGRVIGRLLNRGNRSVVVAAVEGVGVASGATVVEVGFGGGVGLDLLLNRVGHAGVVHGVEVSVTMLAEARRRFRGQLKDGTLHLHETTMDRLPLPTGSVDAVLSTNTIYFVSDLHAALIEIARVLRPHGRLVLGIGDPDAMARAPFTKHGFRLRPVGDVIDQLRQAGLDLIEDRRVGDGVEAFHVLVCERTAG